MPPKSDSLVTRYVIRTLSDQIDRLEKTHKTRGKQIEELKRLRDNLLRPRKVGREDDNPIE